MEKFFKKVSKSNISSSSSQTNESNDEQSLKRNRTDNGSSNLKRKLLEGDLENLPSDPGLRIPIFEYNPNIQYQVRRLYLQRGPCQPRSHEFPQTKFGSKDRRFNPNWFDKFSSWLEYSVSEDKAYCLCCYIFRKEGRGKEKDEAFSKNGFSNWKKPERFELHVGGPNSLHNYARQHCEDLMKESRDIGCVFQNQTDRARLSLRPPDRDSAAAADLHRTATGPPPPSAIPASLHSARFRRTEGSMEKYFKKVSKSNILPSSSQTNESNDEQSLKRNRTDNESSDMKRKLLEGDLENLPSDPGLRIPIFEYNPSIQYQVRRLYLQRGPCQPCSHEFPRTKFGSKDRRFNPNWFDKFSSWLEYSVSEDKAYCLCCYLFRQEGRGKEKDEAFSKNGFSNWKKPERFEIHVGGPNSLHNHARRYCDDLMKES